MVYIFSYKLWWYFMMIFHGLTRPEISFKTTTSQLFSESLYRKLKRIIWLQNSFKEYLQILCLCRFYELESIFVPFFDKWIIPNGLHYKRSLFHHDLSRTECLKFRSKWNFRQKISERSFAFIEKKCKKYSIWKFFKSSPAYFKFLQILWCIINFFFYLVVIFWQIGKSFLQL